MKAVIQDLPIDTHAVDNQGNSAMQNKGKSGSNHDYIPDDGDDDEWWAINAVEVEVIVSQVEARQGKAGAPLPIDKDDEDDDDWGDDELLIEGESD